MTSTPLDYQPALTTEKPIINTRLSIAIVVLFAAVAGLNLLYFLYAFGAFDSIWISYLIPYLSPLDAIYMNGGLLFVSLALIPLVKNICGTVSIALYCVMSILFTGLGAGMQFMFALMSDYCC